MSCKYVVHSHRLCPESPSACACTARLGKLPISGSACAPELLPALGASRVLQNKICAQKISGEQGGGIQPCSGPVPHGRAAWTSPGVSTPGNSVPERCRGVRGERAGPACSGVLTAAASLPGFASGWCLLGVGSIWELWQRFQTPAVVLVCWVVVYGQHAASWPVIVVGRLKLPYFSSVRGSTHYSSTYKNRIVFLTLKLLTDLL